jgi:O-antigen/teichoic acid export membrane protein
MTRAAVSGRFRQLHRALRGPTITGNLTARVGALAALAASSLLVARTGGPAAVGTLALLRVLTWFTGLLLSFGLYGAAPFFLSGPGRSEPRYRSTLLAMAVAAGVVGVGLWVAVSPLFGPRFLPELSPLLLLAAGISVPTQLLETTAKACSQGFDDLTGSNRIIVLEELLFVPFYGLLVAAGASPYLAMIVALPLGDVCNSSCGWIRLWRRGYFRGAGRPSLRLARHIAAYGTRAELNSVTQLLNGRLDFIIVTALVGPAALGIYSVASRTAELLRLPSLAINYVLFPAYARLGGRSAVVEARAAIRRTWWVPAAVAVPVAVAAPVALPLVYGPAFRAAVVPTWILLAGLAGGSVYGVLSAFLSGVGRPGLTSIAQATGLVVTVVLDLALIPHHGIVGAAIASSFAYLTTTGVLMACFRLTRVGSRGRHIRVRPARAGRKEPAGSPAARAPAAPRTPAPPGLPATPATPATPRTTAPSGPPAAPRTTTPPGPPAAPRTPALPRTPAASRTPAAPRAPAPPGAHTRRTAEAPQ